MMERHLFPNSPQAVGQARRFVTEQIREVPQELIEMIGLMVSELATNCVRHTASDFTVEVEDTARDVRVAVTDGGTGEPKVRSPRPNELTGRGLRLVEDLADSFGVEYSSAEAPRDKTVWFVVLLDKPRTRSPVDETVAETAPSSSIPETSRRTVG